MVWVDVVFEVDVEDAGTVVEEDGEAQLLKKTTDTIRTANITKKVFFISLISPSYLVNLFHSFFTLFPSLL